MILSFWGNRPIFRGELLVFRGSILLKWQCFFMIIITSPKSSKQKQIQANLDLSKLNGHFKKVFTFLRNPEIWPLIMVLISQLTNKSFCIPQILKGTSFSRKLSLHCSCNVVVEKGAKHIPILTVILTNQSTPLKQQFPSAS